MWSVEEAKGHPWWRIWTEPTAGAPRVPPPRQRLWWRVGRAMVGARCGGGLRRRKGEWWARRETREGEERERGCGDEREGRGSRSGKGVGGVETATLTIGWLIIAPFSVSLRSTISSSSFEV